MRRLPLVVAFCIAAAVPGYAQDKATLQRLADQWTAAFNKGDTDAVGEMYAGDAVLLPPETQMLKGRDAIQAFWKKEAERVGDLKVTVTEVRPLGTDTAQALITSTLKTKGQQPQEVPGKGVVLVERAGNQWRIVTHIWNRDK